MDKKHWFIEKCSTSVLMVYVIAIFLLTVILFVDKNIDSDRIITAINTGNILILIGELLCSPFVLSSGLRRAYSNLVKVCKIYKSTTDANNHFINGEKAQDFIENKKTEATKKANSHAINENAEKILFYFGKILIILGFSCFLLVFMSYKFYSLVSPISRKLITTTISFLFLLVCMMIKENGDDFLKEVSKETEQITNITSSQLQQEHKKTEDEE